MIKCLTCVICNSFSIIDHVLATFLDMIFQSGVTDVGLSYHQLTYCTRKATVMNKLLKNNLSVVHEKALRKLDIPN